MNALLYPPTHTNCQNCGACCGVILCSKAELREIRKYVKATPGLAKIANSHNKNPLTCQFRDNDDKKCLIYPVRPLICRLFGVTRGMTCAHGNTMEIDGAPFTAGLKPEDLISLNRQKF
ncbi:MAG: YkgJ family cysteine cluster protein [Clostridiales bacterium]|nr:YkgJ family cysteine cluster protein [Clostridiales bacterium]